MTDQLLLLAPAGVSVGVDLDVVLPAPPAQVQPVEHQEYRHSFLVSPYLVDQGIPRDLPMLGVTGRSLVGLGQVVYGDQPPLVTEVVTGAQARWLPTAETFDGISWHPFVGDQSLAWVAGVQASPVLDVGYSYARRKSVVSGPAMIFDGSAWMRLNTRGVSAEAYSIGMVAVLQAGEGAGYSLLESDQNSGVGVDMALRYSHGQITMTTGGPVVSYSTRPRQQAPVVILLTVDHLGGRLSVFDGGRSTRTFSLQNVRAFDIDLLLGRSGLAYDRSSTAVMDVLEIDLFDRALDRSAAEGYLSLMAAAHGVA